MKSMKWALVLILAMTAPLAAKTYKDTLPAKGNRAALVMSSLKVWAYEKNLSAASKVKNVFKKDAATITVKCGFQNNTQKQVKASRGILRFTTYFGEQIYDLSWEAVLTIDPGQSASMEWKIKRDNFKSDKDFETFKKTPLDKMKQYGVPTVIVFADGSTLKP